MKKNESVGAILLAAAAFVEMSAKAALVERASDDGTLARRARGLWSTEHAAQFKFPSWAADEWAGRILPRFGPSALIYHASDNLPEVRSMATFREPTNIAMDRCGSCRTLDAFYHEVLFDDAEKFARIFPGGRFSADDVRDHAIASYYRAPRGGEDAACASSDDGGAFRTNLEGAYRFTDEDYRMPQIAAYARTPMRYVLGDTLYSNEEGVHVLSLVGAGFDAWQQPDYRYYFDKATQDIRADRRGEFYRERQVSIAVALRCAFDHGLDRVEMVPVGAGAFSSLLPRGRVLGALRKALQSDEVRAYKSALEEKLGREIYLAFRTVPPYSHNNGLGPGVPSFYEASGWTGEGRVRDWGDAIGRTLFVNAWDPWSLVGNGNGRDHSVDGFYGRQSALALLCWPITNPHIQYRKVEL